MVEERLLSGLHRPGWHRAAVHAGAALGWLREARVQVEDAVAALDLALALQSGEHQMMGQYRAGVLLHVSALRAEALGLLAEMIDAAGYSAPLDADVHLAHGYLIAGGIAYEDERPAAAIQLYDEVIRRYGTRESRELRDTVGRAFISRAAVLGQVGDAAGAIAACDELLDRLDSRGPEADLPVVLALVLSDRGTWLHRAGRFEEAAAAYTAVLARFAEGEDDEIDQRVRLARDRLQLLHEEAANTPTGLDGSSSRLRPL